MNHTPASALECKRDKWLIFPVLLGAVAMGAIGYFAGEHYLLILGLLAFGCVVYAGVIALDSSVKLRIDDKGISSFSLRSQAIAWDEVHSVSIVEETRGASISHYLRVKTNQGTVSDIEISRLDHSIQEILNVVDRYLGTDLHSL